MSLIARSRPVEGKLAKKDSVMAELLSEYVALKRTWGALTGHWVPHDTRDEVVDFVVRWSEKCEQPARRLVGWLGLGRGKFYVWRKRYGASPEDGNLVMYEKCAPGNQEVTDDLKKSSSPGSGRV